jgi:hypothetical protein
MFQQFDRELGTYIFTDEPSEKADSCTESDEETDTEIVDPHAHHSRSSDRGRSNYFAASPESFIHRNSTTIYPWYPTSDDVLFRYNRVEGLFLGLNSPKQYHWDGHHLNVFGSGGYGFAEHRWRYGGGIANQFADGNRIFEIGAEGHSLTDTKDQWIAIDEENNLSALLLRSDYHDYYGREGLSLWSALYLRSGNTDAQVRVAYLNDRYRSLDRNADWALFGDDRVFRENPAIDDGTMRSILASVDAHHVRQKKYMTTGWSAVASAEFAGKTFGGNFGFNRYILDLRRYQPISDYDNLNLRVRAASATGDVPTQKGFELGGISTMPAYAFKEFSGNRMLLMNAEYVVNGKLFDDSGVPSWLLRNINLILFYDAGYTGTEPSDNQAIAGFGDMTTRAVKSDWGVGAGTRDGKIRLGFAWRTDVSAPVRVFLRLERPF